MSELISQHYNDKNEKSAVVRKDKYHYIVEFYENSHLIKTELITIKASMAADDLAEDWVLEK